MWIPESIPFGGGRSCRTSKHGLDRRYHQILSKLAEARGFRQRRIFRFQMYRASVYFFAINHDGGAVGQWFELLPGFFSRILPLVRLYRGGFLLHCIALHCRVDSDGQVAERWPGFPIGVKFDPSDQQLLEHLAAKLGVGIDKPHPFIDQFIPTLEEEDGICYTHPEKLPGVKQDGSIAHFFYRTAKAYSTGTRRRRKVHCWTDQVGGYVRWHKTGKTRPVIVNGIQKGFKKIMVLYLTTTKGEKPEKTNWVMHQYHLGIEEDEKNNEFVVSKVFYQQQYRECNNNEQEVPQEAREISICNGDSVTPKTTTPELSRPAKRHKDLDTIPEGLLDCVDNPDPETPGTDDLIPSLSEHGRIGVEEEDLHEHDASYALADIELDTPPELQNIDLQSSSLESLLGWVRGKTD